MRALSFAAALVLIACGSPSNGNDGGTDGGVDVTCDGMPLTPPNLVHNNTFECGGANPTEWAAQFGTLDFPSGSAHLGMRNARLTAGNNGAGKFYYTPNVIVDAGTQTICAHAWVKGTTPYMKMRLLLTDATGNGVSSEYSAPGGTDWEREPPTINLNPSNNNAKTVQLVFEVQNNRPTGMNAVMGDTLEIDDVDVWVSSDTNCHER